MRIERKWKYVGSGALLIIGIVLFCSPNADALLSFAVALAGLICLIITAVSHVIDNVKRKDEIAQERADRQAAKAVEKEKREAEAAADRARREAARAEEISRKKVEAAAAETQRQEAEAAAQMQRKLAAERAEQAAREAAAAIAVAEAAKAEADAAEASAAKMQRKIPAEKSSVKAGPAKARTNPYIDTPAARRKAENARAGVACCPRCGSTSLSASKHGYGIGKGLVGASVAGSIGLLAGNIGRKKVDVTCLNCGKRWKV